MPIEDIKDLPGPTGQHSPAPSDLANAQFITTMRALDRVEASVHLYAATMTSTINTEVRERLDRIEAKLDALTKSDAVDAMKAHLHHFKDQPTMAEVERMITDATDFLEMRITENGGLPMTLVAPVRKAIEKYRYISKILLDAMNTSRAPQQRAPYEGGAE